MQLENKNFGPFISYFIWHKDFLQAYFIWHLVMGLGSTHNQLAKFQKKVLYRVSSIRGDSTQHHCPGRVFPVFPIWKITVFFVCSEFCYQNFASKHIGSSVLPALQLPLPPHFSKVGFPKIKSVSKYFASFYHFQFDAEHFWYFSFVASCCSSSYLLFLLQRNMCLVRCVERNKIKEQSETKM